MYKYALTQGASADLAAMETEPSEQPAEQPAYFGLDDSDIEEWLESSSNGSVHALSMAQAPSAVKLLTASVWRGPRTAVPSGDACRVVPPSRSPLALLHVLLRHKMLRWGVHRYLTPALVVHTGWVKSPWTASQARHL